jgi:hypothetical protein
MAAVLNNSWIVCQDNPADGWPANERHQTVKNASDRTIESLSEFVNIDGRPDFSVNGFAQTSSKNGRVHNPDIPMPNRSRHRLRSIISNIS